MLKDHSDDATTSKIMSRFTAINGSVQMDTCISDFYSDINLNRVFHKYTTLAIMPILASEVLLRENKKSGNKMLPLVGIEPLV